MITSTEQHRPAGTAVLSLGPASLPDATSAPVAARSHPRGNGADMRGADRISTTGVVADARTFPGTPAWSPPT